MNPEVIVTPIERIWLGQDGILRAVLNPGAHSTIEHARTAVAAFQKLGAGKKRPLLVDLREVGSVTREAREYFAGEASEPLVHACALLVKSAVSRIIGNFFIGLNRSKFFPVKLFTDEEEAVEWLRGLRER